MSKAFTPRAVERMRPRIVERLGALLAPFGRHDSTELIADFAAPPADRHHRGDARRAGRGSASGTRPSEKGRTPKDFPVETNGQARVEAVRMIPGHKHLVLEERMQRA